LLTINNETRFLAREELKIRPEGGERQSEGINRPISLGKEGFLKREVLKNYSLFLGAFRKE